MTKISEIKEGPVEFQGWIENLRDKKSMQFIVIRDLSGKVQVTVIKEENPEINTAILEVAKYDENIDLKAVALGAYLSYRLIELATEDEGLSLEE